MKNKKKSILKIIIIILIIFILATGVYIIYNVVRYMTYTTKNPAIENQTHYSYDEAYVMNVLVEHTPESQIHYVNIIILDNDTGEEVYAIRNVYRAFDFHWVDWEKDSYNFSLYSGDLGTFCYEYQGDDTWEKHVKMYGQK